ncbi:MAG: CCA tRNA nucleotidyltransferase [Clostridia bacterium]|nr:CCA tRNA nucleotidyltransferase [Clostridia bacterium]
MAKITMPSSAEKIIDTLYENGYEAYIVGGCVRDSLIGREPYDFDITTSAPPERIKEIFGRTVDTGIAHGTVTVICDGGVHEVTTYRIDGEYRDMRHPESVLYTDNLSLDLARRDFTVNALAYNGRVGVVDVFDGIGDLEKKIIRCVREPEERFAEDALRVLRAIRFSSVLDFEIEEKTGDAVRKFAPRLKSISAERIFTEWKKLLSGKRAYEVIKNYSDVILEFIPELEQVRLPEKEAFDSLSYDERQLALFALSSGAQGFSAAAKSLKMDSKTRDTGISVLNNLSLCREMTDNEIKLFLIGKDDEMSLKIAKICAALGKCGKNISRRVAELMNEGSIRKLSQLEIDGSDILSLGIRGERVGKILNELLKLAAVGEIKNERCELLAYVKENNLKA